MNESGALLTELRIGCIELVAFSFIFTVIWGLWRTYYPAAIFAGLGIVIVWFISDMSPKIAGLITEQAYSFASQLNISEFHRLEREGDR